MHDIFQIVRLNEVDKYFSIINEFDINTINANKQNLLHEAIANGRVDIAIDLIERNININQQDSSGLSPLHYCSLYKEKNIAVSLIKKGANINILDIHNNNPLWTAVFNARGEYSLVDIIAKNGGNFDSKNKYHKSPLDFANQIDDSHIIEIYQKYNI